MARVPSSRMPLDFSAEELRRLGIRWLLVIVAVVAGTMLLAALLRSELESVGRAFVTSFGYAGMAIGSFLADAIHFPIPPQFYMLVAVTADVSQLRSLLAIGLGSLAGGVVAFGVARRIAAISAIEQKLARSRQWVERAIDRWGYGAIVLASLTPVAYSVLCNIAGAQRLSWKVFAVLSLCRVPRLVVFYYLVRAGWLAI